MPFIGWLDLELRWWLPVHQPVEAADFTPEQWEAAPRQCDGCPSPLICGVCSYDPNTGHPRTLVPWPCPAVRSCQPEGVPSPRTPTEDDGNYRPRPRRGGTPTAEARERIKGRKF